MKISLDSHYDSLINNLINSGEFNSASEIVNEGLRLLEQQKVAELAEIEYFRREIQKGIDSGSAGLWNKEKFLKEAHKRAGINQE